MSGLGLLIIGLLLCFVGASFVRVGIMLAGVGVGYFLAEAFHASPLVTLLAAAAGALLAYLGTLLIAHLMFFISGVFAGGLVGVKFFVLVDGGDQDWLLAVIVVAAIALLGGFLANRWRKPFLRWATAFAGAGLALSGLGRMGSDFLGNLWRPHSTVGSIMLIAGWALLTIGGRQVQSGKRDDEAFTEPGVSSRR